MKYIVELNDENNYIYISEGVPYKAPNNSITSFCAPGFSTYEYKLIYSTNKHYKEGTFINIDRRYKIRVSKHYKSLDDFFESDELRDFLAENVEFLL